MNQTIAAVQKFLRAKKLDLLVLNDKDTSHRWLLGQVLEPSLVFVPAVGKPTLLMSPLESYASKYWQVVVPRDRDQQKIWIGRMLHGVKRVAVSGSTCSLRLQQLLGRKKFIDVERDLLQLRAVKTAAEIANIRRANALTAQCFTEMMDAWCKFTHENDAVRFIKQFALDHDVGLAFDTICASGMNACVPHHAKNTKLNRGFCVLDFGFDVNGYKADMTRTIYIGKPATEDLLVYNQLLEIQEIAISMVKPGVKCKELHDFVVRSLGSEAKFFIHSLGHGVGLDIHELPNVSPSSDAVLAPGMIVTIEPGIYDPKRKIGIRIEDSLLVTKDGCVVLTKGATKDLHIEQ